MLTKMMKWVAIAMLLLAVFWRSSGNYQVAVEFVVCAGALLVALQAVQAGMYYWGIGFAAIAILFNPIQPFAFSRAMFLWLDLISVVTFAVSLAVLKPKPSLSRAS